MLQSFLYFISSRSKFSTVIKNKNLSLMANIKTVLIDINGTLSVNDKVIPGAVAALQRLRQTPVDVKFVTNTTKLSRQSLYEDITKLGFEIDINEIYTSLLATRDFLKREDMKPFFLLSEDSLKHDFPGFSSFDGKPDTVVVGLAPKHLNRANLNKALRIILDGGTFIAAHKGRYYKAADGLSLGPGPFVKALEYGTGIKALTFGKPNAHFFKGALDKISPENAVMIGDDAKDDVFGAQHLGIRGYLVKTGKYLNGDENKIDPPPYRVVDSFPAAVDDIVSSLKK